MRNAVEPALAYRPPLGEVGRVLRGQELKA
jgi:hypothetical protein